MTPNRGTLTIYFFALAILLGCNESGKTGITKPIDEEKIGDFSPIKQGNLWKYRVQREAGDSLVYEGNIVISIGESYRSGDTLVFPASIRESDLKGNDKSYLEQIMETKDGRMDVRFPGQ